MGACGTTLTADPKKRYSMLTLTHVNKKSALISLRTIMKIALISLYILNISCTSKHVNVIKWSWGHLLVYGNQPANVNIDEPMDEP